MPKAAAIPSARDLATAVRTTKTKLGPGLIAPMNSDPRIAKSMAVVDREPLREGPAG